MQTLFYDLGNDSEFPRSQMRFVQVIKYRINNIKKTYYQYLCESLCRIGEIR